MITLYSATGEALNVSIQSTPDLKELQERNRARVEQVKQSMGTKYLLHPANQRTRLSTPR